MQANVAHETPNGDKSTGAFALATDRGSVQFIGTRSDAHRSWESLLTAFGVVSGVAEDAKPGAVVTTDDGRAYDLEQREGWPPGLWVSRVWIGGKRSTVGAPAALSTRRATATGTEAMRVRCVERAS